MPGDSKNIFNKEILIVERAHEISSRNDFDKEQIGEEYNLLVKNYQSLLNETKLLTSVSDRLQNKLNTANDKLKNQAAEIREINKNLEIRNVELVHTIEAATIVLIMALILFLLSEYLLEPIVEVYTDKNILLDIAFKGGIVLLLKPLESLVESQLLKRAAKKKTSLASTT